MVLEGRGVVCRWERRGRRTRRGRVRGGREADGSGQKTRPLDLKTSIESADIFHGYGKLEPVGKSDGVLDPCVEGRTLLTLVSRGGAMGKGARVDGRLRAGGIRYRRDMGVGLLGGVELIVYYFISYRSIQ